MSTLTDDIDKFVVQLRNSKSLDWKLYFGLDDANLYPSIIRYIQSNETRLPKASNTININCSLCKKYIKLKTFNEQYWLADYKYPGCGHIIDESCARNLEEFALKQRSERL